MKFKTITINNTIFRIVHNKEWGEYQVKVNVEGRYVEGRSYFTNDLTDAIESLEAMVNEEVHNIITQLFKKKEK